MRNLNFVAVMELHLVVAASCAPPIAVPSRFWSVGEAAKSKVSCRGRMLLRSLSSRHARLVQGEVQSVIMNSRLVLKA
jgi:hypothetical protein